jgi:hypothetical protein
MQISNTLTYQLLQIPPTNLHIPLVLIQTLREHLRIILTASRSIVIARVCVLSGLSDSVGSGLRFSGRRAGASAEEAADGVADGGAYGDTAIGWC